MTGLGDLYAAIRRAEVPFVVAELANAHEGVPGAARALVEAAARAGAPAVKFQKFTADELLVPQHPRYGHFGRLEMTDAIWAELVTLAHSLGLYVIVDVFGDESAELMHRLGVDGYKIHSSDVINLPLVRRVAAYGRTVFLSCGGARQLEVLDAVRTIREAGNDRLVLLHGFQSYPTRLENTNLQRIPALAAQFGCPVGLADHVAGESEWAFMLPLLAVAAGATVIEKHITLDRSRRGIDFYSSLEPEELRRLIGLLGEASRAVGSGPWEMSEAEHAYLHQVKKLLIASVDVPAGTPIDESMLTYKRAVEDVHPLAGTEVIGRSPRLGLKANQVVTLDQFPNRVVACVAVRMHSTRLPRKALLPLAGRPALTHLFDRLRLAKSLASIVVCTSTHPDDEVLADLARASGIRWFRGSEDDVMGRFLDAATAEAADTIVRVTGDDLLVDPEMLDVAVEFHLARNADYTAYPGLPKGMETEIISVRAMRRAHELAEDPSFTEYMTYYLRRPDVFRVSEMPVPERCRKTLRLTLDTLEDYRVLQALFDGLYRPGEVFGTEEVIRFMEAHPDLVDLNRGVRPKDVTINTNLRVQA